MDLKEIRQKALVASVLPAVMAVFVIFFLVMPKVRENRRVQSELRAGNPVSGEVGSDTAMSFEECVAAGGPIMESYPRQCRHGGQTFVEVLDDSLGEEAALLSAERDAGCSEVGSLAPGGMFNPNSRTWWFDLVRGEEESKDGCAPACVVKRDTGEVEVNWRCTGLRME